MITAVVLGGTSIYGGRGTIFGSVIAVFLVGFLRTGLGVANVKAESQLAVVGTLLIIAVIASNVIARFSRQRASMIITHNSQIVLCKFSLVGNYQS